MEKRIKWNGREYIHIEQSDHGYPGIHLLLTPSELNRISSRTKKYVEDKEEENK